MENNREDDLDVLRKIKKNPSSSQRELAKELNFSLGNVVKYISRAGIKDPNRRIEDLKKAKWYLEREIERQNKTSD